MLIKGKFSFLNSFILEFFSYTSWYILFMKKPVWLAERESKHYIHTTTSPSNEFNPLYTHAASFETLYNRVISICLIVFVFVSLSYSHTAEILLWASSNSSVLINWHTSVKPAQICFWTLMRVILLSKIVFVVLNWQLSDVNDKIPHSKWNVGYYCSTEIDK